MQMVNAEDWLAVAEATHSVVFGEKRPASFDRIDFALVAEDETGKPFGYITAREFDALSLYWQYGGTFPGTIGTSKVWGVYSAAIDWVKKQGYHRITTLVESENIGYLHLAMRMGFRIIGCRLWQEDGKSTVLCELRLNLR